MKKISMLRGIGLLVPILSLTLVPAGAQEVGETYTILLPAGSVPNANRYMVVVKGMTAKAATTVGTCRAGEYRPQEVEIVDRDGEEPTTTADMIVVDLGYRNDPPPFNGIVMTPGTRLGSFRGGGVCGPGYVGVLAHVIVGE